MIPAPFNTPVALVALTVAIILVLHWQRGLTLQEARLAQLIKCWLFAGLDDRANGRLVGVIHRIVARTVNSETAGEVSEYINEATDKRPLVRTKGLAEDPDFVRTWDATPRATATTLLRTLDPHLIATAKRRALEPGGFQWAWLQLVKLHDDGTQTEVYIFPSGDGRCDIYAHHETAVTDPEGHVGDGQTHGDPRGVIPAALQEGTHAIRA